MGNQPGIVVVDHAVMPVSERQIFANPNPPAFNPRATQLIRRDEYQVGLDDLQELNDDYSRILSQDLRYRTHRGPDGRVDGIQITNVSPNSLPARHGVTGGEIIKSINGHPVKSVNEAIAYVKKEAEKTDTWVVVYEKQGRTYTRTYHSPNE
jgi:S1-C subfamily serine protease